MNVPNMLQHSISVGTVNTSHSTDNFDRDYYRQYWLDECHTRENQTSTEFYRDGESLWKLIQA